uniref:YGGT family protein n=1 Tax=Arundo donax TaxID=35708 RepID=A0A0A8XQS3_ARUDO
MDAKNGVTEIAGRWSSIGSCFVCRCLATGWELRFAPDACRLGLLHSTLRSEDQTQFDLHAL